MSELPQALIVGSIGIDTIDSPFGQEKDIFGGSAVYASLAASYFSQPVMLSVCGKDLPRGSLEILDKTGVDYSHLLQEGKTFRWHGQYGFDGHVKTIATEFNGVSPNFPTVPSKPPKFVLLGNTNPEIQLKIIEQLPKNTFILADTIEFWIQSKLDSVKEVFSKVSAISITEGEARQITGSPNLVLAGKYFLSLGLQFVVLKKGENGALVFFKGQSSPSIFSSSSYPLETVKDPTGAGDSLAGGLIGYLAQKNDLSEKAVRQGVVYGSIIASFAAENFGTQYRLETDYQGIKERYQFVQKMRDF